MTAVFAAIFVIFIFSVAMRYLAQRPLAWADELNIILLLWVMFIGGAFVVRDNEHVAFDIVWQAARPPVRRTMGIVAALAMGGLFLAAFPAIYSYITFLWRERTSVLEWRLDIVYFCFVIFLAAVILRFAGSLVRLCGRDWRTEVGEVTNPAADAADSAVIEASTGAVSKR